jgi:hypothetical protein
MKMKLLRTGAAATVCVGLILAAAPGASAAPPVGSCPGKFFVADENRQREVLRELFPGADEDFITMVQEEALASIDKNGDRTLCLLPQPQRGDYNAIDNVAGGGNR